MRRPVLRTRGERALALAVLLLAGGLGLDALVRGVLLDSQERSRQELATELRLRDSLERLLDQADSLRTAAAGLSTSVAATPLPTRSSEILTAVHNVAQGRVTLGSIDPLRADAYTLALDGTAALNPLFELMRQLQALGGSVTTLSLTARPQTPGEVQFRIQCRFEHVQA